MRPVCILFALAVVVAAAAAGPAITVAAAEGKAFVHPGILHSAAEIEFIRAKTGAGEEPWKSAREQFCADAVAQLSWTPRPRAEVVRGANNSPDLGGTDLLKDGSAAHAHALQWCLTGRKAHAEKAIEILNAYAATLRSVGGHDARLLVGMSGLQFLNAAELVRHTHDGWRPEDLRRFEELLRSVLYPVIKDFYPTANGNWDAAMIQTLLAMGVFLDDRAMFDRAAGYFMKGGGNGAIGNYLNKFGECQESGRDQAHTQMGLGYLGCACEIAWKQGVDLYGALGGRLALGFEYTARYNLGQDVPYEPYRSVEGRYAYPAISDKARGRFSPIYERVYHHYHDRMGMPMPWTEQVIRKMRPEGFSTVHASWGTLLCAGLPAGARGSDGGR